VKLPPSSAWQTRTQTLAVQTSTDGASFATVVASANYSFNPATGNAVDITVPATTARYVRLTITANSGWPAGQLSDFEVFATGGGGGSATLATDVSSLAFPDTPVNTNSDWKVMTVTNTGTATATVSSITATGDFTRTTTCGPTIAAGANCTVTVTFHPSAAGNRTGTLSIVSNATNSPTVALSGTGTAVSAGNLCLNRPTTQSSSTQNYGSGNAVDGNANSYWESANNAFPQWIQCDLGSAQTVSRVVVKLPPPSAWATRSQTIAVSGSVDGTTFTTLKAAASYVFNPATGNTVTITFPATTIRYVRLTFTANTGWPAGQCSEFEAYAA
jgi:hypothetical protein